MKKSMKLLLALLLAMLCLFAYTACAFVPGTGGQVETPDVEDDTDDETTDDETDDSDAPVKADVYKLALYYSYTATIKNAYLRPETVQAKNEVLVLEIPKANPVLTADHLKAINDALYNGYGFAEWYAEEDWVIDVAGKKQYPAVGATPHTFNVNDTISSDLSFFGVKGNLAGRNAYWEVTEEQYTDANGKVQKDVVLTISGSGKMFDYEETNIIDIPWYGSVDKVNKIVISDDITYIGKNAFNGFSGVSTVVMNNVSEIGGYAFKGLTKFKTFIAPDELKTIGRNAFEGTGLTTVYLNDGLTVIDQYAFFASKNISSLLLPSTVTTIGQGAFAPGIGLSASQHSLRYVYYMGNYVEGKTAFANIDVATDNESLVDIPTIYYLLDNIFDVTLAPASAKTYDGTLVINNKLNGAGEIGGTYYYKNVSGSLSVYTDEECKELCDDFVLSLSDGKHYITCEELGSSPVLLENVLDGGNATNRYEVKYSMDYGLKGPYWSFFTTRENTVVPMQHCLTVKYYLPGENYVSWIDYVMAEPVRSVNDKGVVSYNLVGYLDAENIQHRIDNVKHHGYRFATYGDEGKYLDEAGKACNFIEGAKMSGDLVCNLGRGKILSEKGGIVFTYSGDTVTVSLDPAAIAEGGSDRTWDFTAPLDTQVLWTGATSGLIKIKKLVIGEGITYIGSYAFNGLVSVTEVVIPSTVKGISSNAFSGCSRLSSIYYSGDLSDCAVYDESGRITNKKLSDNGVLSGISDAKFYSACNASSTTADGSFWKQFGAIGADGLPTQHIVAWTLDKRAGTLLIGGDPVMYDFPSETATPWYGAEVLNSVHTVQFANNITKLGEYVIHGYRNVVNIGLPADLQYIPETALSGTGLVLNVAGYEGGMLVLNNHLIKVDPSRKNTELLVVDFGTVTIAGGAFDGCFNVKEMYIPLTVRYINPGALDDVNGLKVVYTDSSVDGWTNLSVDSGITEYVHIYTNGNWDSKTYRPLFYDCEDFACTHEGICKHEWGDWYIKQQPTHTVDGIRARPCLVPGCEYEEYDRKHEDVVKKNQRVNGDYVHVYGDYLLDQISHCTNNLTETATCIYCDVTITREIEDTSLGGHAYGPWTANNDATCSTLGTKTRTCTNENCLHTETVDDDEQPMLPHTPDNSYVLTDEKKYSSPCSANHHYYLYCTVCGEPVEDPIERPNTGATEHEWTEYAGGSYIFKRASKTGSNMYYKSCSVCGLSALDADVWDCNELGEKFFTDYGTYLNYYGWDETVLEEIISSESDLALENNMDSEYTYAATVLLGASKALAIGKRDGATSAVVNIVNSYTRESGFNRVCHIFDTEITLGAYEGAADYVYRLGLNTIDRAFFNLYFVANENDGFDIVASLEDDADVIATVEAGVESKITIKYDDFVQHDDNYVAPEGDLETCGYYHKVFITVNDQESLFKVYLNKFDVAVDPEAENITLIPEFDDGAPLYVFDHVSVELNEAIKSGCIYLDETYLGTHTNNSWGKPTNTTPDPDYVETTPGAGESSSPDYVFGDVELDEKDTDGVIESPVDGVTVTVKDGAKDENGKYQYVNTYVDNGAFVVQTWKNAKGSAFAAHTAFNVSANIFNGAVNSTYVFDAALVVYGGTHRLTFTNASASLHSVAFDISVIEEEVTLEAEEGEEPKTEIIKKLIIKDAYKGLDGVAEEFEVVVADDCSFNLRIELYSFSLDGDMRRMAKIYVGSEYVGTTDCSTVVSKKVADYAINSVVFYHKVDEDGMISFADVIVSNEILALDGEEIYADFIGNITEPDGLVEKPAANVTVSSGEGEELDRYNVVQSEIRNGKLLVSVKGDSYVGTTAFSLPGVIGKCDGAMFSFVGAMQIIEGTHRMSFGEGGFALDLAISEDGELVISEVYEGADQKFADDVVISGIENGVFTIEVDLYVYETESDNAMVARVYVNGELVSISDSYNDADCDVDAVIFTHGADSQIAFVDVTVFEAYTNVSYVPEADVE